MFHKCQSNRKLNAFEFNWHICGKHWNAWHQNMFASKFSIQNGGFDNFFINFLMTNRVPLLSRCVFKFRNKITGDPTFSRRRCGGMPGKSIEFRNCWIIYCFVGIANGIDRFLWYQVAWQQLLYLEVGFFCRARILNELCSSIGKYAVNESILRIKHFAEIGRKYYTTSIFMDSNLLHRRYLTPWLMEPGRSMPHSQGLSNNSYPEPNQPNYPHWYLSLQGPF